LGLVVFLGKIFALITLSISAIEIAPFFHN